MGKKVILGLFFFIFLISFISAEGFGYNYLEGELNVAQAVNYTEKNVNNSIYFQSYTPTTLGSWLETTFSWITNAVDNLVNYYTKTEIETNYIPYTGANANVDLGDNNFTVNDSTFFVDTNKGWVGIGTTSPVSTYKLDINGTAIIGDQSTTSMIPDHNILLLENTVNTVDRNVYGLNVALLAYPTENSAKLYYGSFYNIQAGTGDYDFTGRTVGFQGQTNWKSTGTLAQSRGVAGFVTNSNTGTITNAYGAMFGFGANSGTITNSYGLYVGDITSGIQTNTPFSIYSSDSNAYNYFAGDTGIGTKTPQNKLNVIGDGNFTGLIYGNGSQLTDVTLAEVDPYWSANFTLYNASWSAGGTDTFIANYSTFLDISIWNDTGLIQDWNATGFIRDWSGSSSDATWLANWTAYNTTWSTDLNTWDTSWFANWTAYNSTWSSTCNSTYNAYNSTGLIQDWNATGFIKDWSGDSSDTTWIANYTLYNNTGWTTTDLEIWNVASNGTFLESFTELDPYWSANYTAYNDSWNIDTTYSQGTNMSFDGTTINWDGSWVLSVFAKISDLTAKVSWTDLWAQVYNKTEVNAINTSMKNYVDGLSGGEGASVGNTKTQVWTATNCPTSWTDIDLSGIVGSNSALVHISFQSTAGDMNSISLRANGDTTEYHEKTAEVSAYGIAVGHHDSGGTATGGAVVLSTFTDNNGIVEWICESQEEADAYLLGWVG